jgi:hypothetical protein
MMSSLEDEDEFLITVHVLSFMTASHDLQAKACALALELQDLDDDKLADHLEGNFSVDGSKPVYDVLGQICSGPASIFYNQTGFTLEEWKVTNSENSNAFLNKI